MMALPVDLETGIQTLLDRVSRKAMSARAEAMSDAYRAGRRSAAAVGDRLDIAAYLAARMPATFAAVAASLAEAGRRLPGFAPKTLLDVCSGPGTAAWAAIGEWPDIAAVAMLDGHRGFLGAARDLAESGVSAALKAAAFIEADVLKNTGPLPAADLVVMAYAMVELPDHAIAALAERLWAAAQVLVLVEPGTPQGFSRINLCREALTRLGAFCIAPCPHDLPCPIVAPDWCHFSIRLPRSRDHRLIKGASTPFEDERYAYLAVGRSPIAPKPTARILAPVRRSKASIDLKLCVDGAVVRKTLARSDPAFKPARKSEWGDAFPDADIQD